MNKKIINILLITIIFLLIILIFKNNILFLTSINDSLILFITKVFPFLFIMMILNNLLIKCNLPYYLNIVFKRPEIYIIIMSILSGCPINAIIIKNYLDNKIINEKDASIILSFTCFNNPLFLYNSLFNILNNNKNVIFFMMLIYFINLIYYLLIRNKLSIKNIQIKYENYNLKKELFGIINNTLLNLLKIMGIIIFFKTITDLIFLKAHNILTTILKGIIEITQGLYSISLLNISIKIKQIIAYTIICFSGLSIQMQLSLILENYNINYKYFYLSRFIIIILGIIILLF
ncbi:MAG: hypothetical protein ACI4XR_05595 [Bacilli bacterium]